MPINQPMNQIKLTNVSLVRMKKGISSALFHPAMTDPP